MGNVVLVGHLSETELYERYRSEKDGTRKLHLQVIWLRSQKKRTSEIADQVGYNSDWVRRLIHRYNVAGVDSLGDRRQTNGRSPSLTEEEQGRLLAALKGRAPDGGLWNGPKVLAWIQRELGQTLSKNRGRAYLYRLGLTLKQPRPRHILADPEAQAAFKKNWQSASRSARTPRRPDRLKSGAKTRPGWAFCRSSGASGAKKASHF